MAQLGKDGQAEFDRLQRMGQNMATNMVAMARRAAEHASMLNQQSEQLKAYRAELEKSAKRIEEESAHLVQIEVAKPPKWLLKGRRHRAAKGRDPLDGQHARPHNKLSRHPHRRATTLVVAQG